MGGRDITLPTKICLVKVMVFPVVIYGCESWTIKKADHQRIDAFKLWCWKRLLRVPWIAKRSNQSVIKEINPEYSLEELKQMQRELTHWKRPWGWERLRAGGEGTDRGWDGWMASLTQWTWVTLEKEDQNPYFLISVLLWILNSSPWLNNSGGNLPLAGQDFNWLQLVVEFSRFSTHLA